MTLTLTFSLHGRRSQQPSATNQPSMLFILQRFHVSLRNLLRLDPVTVQMLHLKPAKRTTLTSLLIHTILVPKTLYYLPK